MVAEGTAELAAEVALGDEALQQRDGRETGPAVALFGTRPVLMAGAATAVTLLVPAVWRIRDTSFEVSASPTAEKR
ncbi:hypothetical protein [Streptosporangium roseum]|uniref:hypothetical protein n=1 Tax=Streptosporangium roseum TaxID=2001 RepID=UPI0004CCEDB1|nr:hypothetical protein [Streptosporangium roseum]